MTAKTGRARANGKDKRLVTQQSVNAAVRAICDIMRRSNCAGALQYVPELTWILFLRILDERETREHDEAEAVSAELPHPSRRLIVGRIGLRRTGSGGRPSRPA